MKNLKGRLSAFVLLAAFALCLTGVSEAQAPSNIYAAGVSVNPGQNPSVAGTLIWAHALNASGTYAGTIVDILPQTIKPIVVNTNIGVFAAQKIATIGTIPVYGTGSTGISLTGTNTGWSYSAGGAAMFKLPNPNFYMMATVRVSKSTVSGSTGYQLIPGVEFAWGQ
jgi:hypothetical protein